jgi:hypothetical protein
MKIKILKTGESAKEIEVQEGATVEHAIQSSVFSRGHMTVTLNGHPTFTPIPKRWGRGYHEPEHQGREYCPGIRLNG